MARDQSTNDVADLYAANTLEAFWKPLLDSPISTDEWDRAVRAARSVLPRASEPLESGSEDPRLATLGEGIFGPRRWQLSLGKRLYYELKPWLPRRVAIVLRQQYRQTQEHEFALGWPVEDRYVRFQYECLTHVMRQRGLHKLAYLNFWPDGHRFALVLTHDVEEADGQRFVEQVANLEEELGFRSSFNFVPERYPIDGALFASLRQRGFEIGVHGLKHDGKLFSTRHTFEQRAAKINAYLRGWGAVGFRAPLMHRNAEWLQALNVEYDLSFFDTDPHEPMAGGTQSIWPFFLGSFVELPYTLTQDHTLMVILGERTPRLWLEKVAFIERWRGMALVNTHPDYLLRPGNLDMYAQFLRAVRERADYWHALPRDVARWWTQRAHFEARHQGGAWNLDELSGATVGHVLVDDDAGVSGSVHALRAATTSGTSPQPHT